MAKTKKSWKFKLIIAGIIVGIVCLIFTAVIVAQIFMTVLAIYEKNKESAEGEVLLPITFSGTLKGSDISLNVNGEGVHVSGIDGTVKGDGTYTARNKVEGGMTNMPLPKDPPANLSNKTWMPQFDQSLYSYSLNRNSAQYKLNQTCTTDAEGFRKKGASYLVALGSFYGSEIGAQYQITFQQKDGSTKTISAVLGDQKANKDTDSKHQYHNKDGSVVEFIMGDRKSSNSKVINKKFGKVSAIAKKGSSQASLYGEIKASMDKTQKEKRITVSGDIDGVPVQGEGTVKQGKIKGEGYYGDGASGMDDTYSGGEFLWPVPGVTRITSEYGMRNCPFHGREFHSGIDIAASSGKSVVAAADGTVVLAGYNGSYGNCVIISHGSGLFTLYGHNSSLLTTKNQKVKKGQKIAKVGSTGASTGPHLHFEVRSGGNAHKNHVSPWKYLKKK